MVQEPPAPSVDRPPPGHYQAMLGTVLGRVSLSGMAPSSTAPTALHRVRPRSHRRRTGQLALPLEVGTQSLRGRR